jgi:hypothetical protein
MVFTDEFPHCASALSQKNVFGVDVSIGNSNSDHS